MAEQTKKIDSNVVAELEQSKNEVLQRIAKKLKAQMEGTCVSAGHSSHSSGSSGRTHSSTTTH